MWKCPSWSPQMIPISMLVLGYALNCRENLTFQTLGFGILVFGNNGAQCACKDNFQNEVVGCFFQEMVKKTMAFLIKYRQLCSCFPQMSLSTSFSPFQHVPQKQFRTSHGFPWSNGMAFQKTFPDSGSVSRLSTCRKELQESDAAWSWWFFWINLIRKYEGTNATAYIWDNAMFFLLLDCWFGDVKKRWLVHQKSVTSLFIIVYMQD